MTDNVAAFPLCWPEGWPRSAKRQADKFADWTVFSAVQGLLEELRLMGARDAIVSTSVPLRKSDGLPLSKPPVDGDPGAAVYFKRGDRSQCIAIDRYTSVEANLRAITLTVEAMRTIHRHGGAEILDRAFTGFAALPQNAGEGVSWWTVLGVSPNAAEADVKSAYRRLARERHPDNGGSDAAMASLNLAMEEWEASRGR